MEGWEKEVLLGTLRVIVQSLSLGSLEKRSEGRLGEGYGGIGNAIKYSCVVSPQLMRHPGLALSITDHGDIESS